MDMGPYPPGGHKLIWSVLAQYTCLHPPLPNTTEEKRLAHLPALRHISSG